MADTALTVSDVSMTFPGTRALDGVNLQLRRGEVHGLVGHNGSGKSTLIKVLSGQYLPDAGSRVTFGDEELQFNSPASSESLGLRVVHQNLGLIPEMSVTDNVLVGSGFDTEFGGRISWRRERRRVAEQLERLGYHINPRVPVAQLGVAARSAVAIARALMPRSGQPNVKVLLLDEVTATMPDAEIERLLKLVASLRERDVAVMYVTHHLEEVLEICDTVTALRDGRVAASVPATDLTVTSLTDLVVGSAEWRQPSDPSDHRALSAEVVASNRLVATHLRGGLVEDLSLTLEPGRIVGISGITGSGREDVAPLIMGTLDRSGTITVGGQAVPPGNPVKAVLAGLSVVPADRHANAVVPGQNIRENMTLAAMCRTRALSPLMARGERPTVRDWIRQLNIRSAQPERGMDMLSGGNQQKVVMARSLYVNSKVLLLDEPTQGVDAAAVAEIHARIRELASDRAVLVCSSDSLELTTLCDEVIVLQRGRVVGRVKGEAVTEHNLDRLQLAAVDKYEAGTTPPAPDSADGGPVGEGIGP